MQFNIDDSFGYWINVMAGKLKNELNRTFSNYEITAEQWAVLNRLWDEDGITQKELAERTAKDQPNTGRILEKLEKKGFVSRHSNSKDRRILLVVLTPKGRQFREEMIAGAEEVLQRARKDITDDKLEVLKKILQKMSRNL
jgi:DNA-binding MarR family transcriptional regulator